MAKTYEYKAKDRSGQLHTGSILADSETAVALHCREKGYFVLQIKEQGRPGGTLGAIADSLQTVKTKDLAVVCRQFATMVDAGLSLVACLSVLIDQTANPRIKAALQSVYKKVKEGETFSSALAEHPRVFPTIMVNMVEAGEVGGVLDDVLSRLATHFEKEHKLNEKVKSAMTYPAVVITMAILCVVFILTFVMPTFLSLFAGMKVELPWPTRLLLAVSDFLKNYWWLVLLELSCLLIALKVAYTKESTRKQLDQLILRLPIVGPLTRKIAIARFSRTLSTLVRGGVPIITALDVVKRTIGNLSMMDALTQAQTSVQEGVGLASTLSTSKIFTPMVIHMVAIGEESGALDKMLEKVADFYESEVEDTVSRLSSIMEPVIVGILGVAIGFIVISVMLPLFDVITNFGGTNTL